LLGEINERGTTVVMATHDHSAVDRMRRRVIELVEGLVVRDDQEGRYESVTPHSVISGNRPDDSRHRGADPSAPATDTSGRRAPGEPPRDVVDEELLDERDASRTTADDAFAADGEGRGKTR